MNDRIELARELAGTIIDDLTGGIKGIEDANKELLDLLRTEGELEDVFLPGGSVEAIRSNIVTALELASQPMPAIATGRDREGRKHRAECQRARLHLLCRVVLTLLDQKPTTESSSAAAKLAAIQKILEIEAA